MKLSSKAEAKLLSGKPSQRAIPLNILNQPQEDRSSEADAGAAYQLLQEPPSTALSLELQTFLSTLELTQEDLQQASINPKVLSELLNRKWSGRLLRWLSLDDIVLKALLYPFLNKQGIENAVIKKEDLSYRERWKTYFTSRVFPKATALPFKSEIMLRRAYGVTSFFESVELVVTRVWSLLLASLLAQELYYYYTYPDEHYDNTLFKIFSSQSTSQDTLSASLLKSTVWPELIIFPTAWGLVKAFSSAYGATALTPQNITELVLSLKDYQPSFGSDLGYWLSPLYKLRRNLNVIKRVLIWDNRITPEEKLALFKALFKFTQRSSKISQLQALEKLCEIADGIAVSDFPRLFKLGMEKEALLALLSIKTQALMELQRHAGTLLLFDFPKPQVQERTPQNLPNGYLARCFSLLRQGISSISKQCEYRYKQSLKFTKPLPRYLWAHYLLWCLGQPQSRFLQPFFWSFKAAKLYVKVQLVLTLYRGISEMAEWYRNKKACEDQGRYWIYLDRIADYNCTFCDARFVNQVFFRNIFTAKDFLKDYLRFPRDRGRYQNGALSS